ncbi:MAG: hypothetical protein GY757_22490, partial [bacterium]|nr:hypothetical protein [bacterium]
MKAIAEDIVVSLIFIHEIDNVGFAKIEFWDVVQVIVFSAFRQHNLSPFQSDASEYDRSIEKFQGKFFLSFVVGINKPDC